MTLPVNGNFCQYLSIFNVLPAGRALCCSLIYKSTGFSCMPETMQGIWGQNTGRTDFLPSPEIVTQT